jgi:hypothetical protein
VAEKDSRFHGVDFNGCNRLRKWNLSSLNRAKILGLAGASSEEQQPNVIYAMYYYGITGELRSTSIDKAKVKQKVEAAVKAAGFHIT